MKQTPKITRLVVLLVIALTTFSCIPQKKLIYYQDSSDKRRYESPYHPAETITETYQIRTNDYLFVRVLTPNSETQMYYNVMGTSSIQGSGNSENSSSKYNSYMVDDDGNIDFPNVGMVNVMGLTRKQAKEKLDSILGNHLVDYSIQVHLSNTHFTLLGEANAGTYPMIKDQMTIWEALGTSGDLTTYSKRKNVKIIRPMPDGKSVIQEINLTDLSLLDSQESYIYPNDIIYVEPLRAKMWGFGETFSLGLITSLITFYLLIASLVN